MIYIFIYILFLNQKLYIDNFRDNIYFITS